MAKKKSKKKWIILGVVAVVVLLAVFGFLRMRANMEALSKTTYEITTVSRGTVEVKVKGAGAATPLVDKTVYASFTGSVSEVFAENGDIVKADDVVVVFESDALQTEKEQIEQQIDQTDSAISVMRQTTGSTTVYSPVEGVIKVMYAQEGDNVDVVMDEFGALCVICPDELLQADLAASEGVKAGDAVTVTVGETSVQAIVYSIEDGVMTVQFEDDDFTVGDKALVTSESGSELGTANIEIANPVYITAQGGTVEDVRENVGDSVKARTKLFTLEGEILSADLYSQIEKRKDLQQDLDDIKGDIEALTVRAGSDGVVSGITLNTDQMVQAGAPLFAVQSNEQVKLEVQIDEIDIVNIQLGQEASVEFDALPDKTYTAKVIKINPIGISTNNVTDYTITLEIEPAQEIMLGMSADVEIVSKKAENALLIPIQAIQIIDGEKYVVFEEDVDEELDYTVATHKIETGITDGVMIEVISGLNEGDRVAVPQAKQLTSQEMMFGGPRRAADDEE